MSRTFTERVPLYGVPAVVDATEIDIDAGTPLSVTDSLLVLPAVIVYVGDAVEITAPFASYVVSVNVSLPGGTDGPGTLQPLAHELVSVVVTLVCKPFGMPPGVTELSVMFTEEISAVTYFGERFALALLLAVALADFEGMLKTQLVGTVFVDDDGAALPLPFVPDALIAAGVELPPPEHAARTSVPAAASMRHLKEVSDFMECSPFSGVGVWRVIEW